MTTEIKAQIEQVQNEANNALAEAAKRAARIEELEKLLKEEKAKAKMTKPNKVRTLEVTERGWLAVKFTLGGFAAKMSLEQAEAMFSDEGVKAVRSFIAEHKGKTLLTYEQRKALPKYGSEE